MTTVDPQPTRREILKKVVGGTLVAAASTAGCGQDVTSGSPDAFTGDAGGADAGLEGPTPACEETDDNILGPFYRPNAPLRTDLNVHGRPGLSLRLEGIVF